MKRLALLLVLLFALPAFAQQQVPIVSGVVTIDAILQANSKVILNGNVSSVVLVNPRPAGIVTILFAQDSTGSRTVTFGGNIASANLPTITSTANAYTYINLQYDTNSNTWYGISAVGSGGGGGGTPCVTTALSFQYNNAGAFGCVADLTLTGAHTLTLGASGIIAITAGGSITGITAAMLPNTIVYNNQSNTWSTGAQDFSSATSLKVPISASLAPTTAGLFGYDSTNNRFVGGNGTNTSFFTWLTGAPVTGHCPQFSGTAGLLVDSGAACAGTGITGLTTGFIPKASSATAIANSLCDEGITTANVFTCTDSAGAAFSGPIKLSGTTAGADVYTAGTANGHATASTVTVEAPATIATAYEIELPNAAPTAGNTFLSCTAANPAICSFAAGGSGGAPGNATMLAKTANYTTLSTDFSSATTAPTLVYYIISSSTSVTHTLPSSVPTTAGAYEIVENSCASAPFNLILSPNAIALDGSTASIQLSPCQSIMVFSDQANSVYRSSRGSTGPLGTIISTAQVAGASGGNNVTSGGGAQVIIGAVLTVTQPTTVAHVLFHTGVADVVVTDFYMIGIMPFCAATTACVPIATTGPLAGNSTGIGTTGVKNIALTASTIIPPGQYLAISCGVTSIGGAASTWQAQGNSNDFPALPFTGQQSATTCTSAGFPATVTMPAAGAAEINGVPNYTFAP